MELQPNFRGFLSCSLVLLEKSFPVVKWQHKEHGLGTKPAEGRLSTWQHSLEMLHHKETGLEEKLPRNILGLV